ncbi:Lrp/AsnC family transcriptional regulator [Segnochrobactrum spirostomi]|uniref:Lrp/AsnC family transcriptional regulator n=1 Tax=Segnochrobactrum spirostomi TaxID=2608987 RepID=A0A6A7XZQ0_9HYPH|nr:Lrp/AsnC family transcriptional regulator [Segnochrobactrum spirostomi]MQT11758.1 Lrp/AsnC family transcriptional regulator [Segnochrobactrum spirostomi]
MRDELDSIDRRILAELQKDARLPMATLAAHVGLSVPACYRRVRALREAQIIVREVAVVAPKSLGWPLSMIVLVVLEREGARTNEDLMRKFEKEPEISAAWQVTGSYDFVLHVLARDMESYDAFALRVLSEDERIRMFHTHVVIRGKTRAPIVPV